MMKKTYTVYDTDAYSDYFDEIKCSLEESDECEYSNSEIWDYINDMINNDFYCVVSLMKNYCYGAVIVYGSLGRWDGHYNVHKFVNDNHDGCYLNSADWKDILLSIRDDSVKFYVDTETMDLCVDTANHDGSSSFIVAMIDTENETFEEDYEKYYYGDMEIGEIIEKYAKPIGADYLHAFGVL